MLLVSLSAEFTLIHMPEVRGALPAGGLLGTVLAEGLRAAFNPIGRQSGVDRDAARRRCSDHQLFVPLRARLDEEADGQRRLSSDRWIARVKDWREEREAATAAQAVEEIKIAGRPPVAQQRVSTKETSRRRSGRRTAS